MAMARMLSEDDQSLACRVRTAAMAELDKIFERVDVIVTPALGCVPPLVPHDLETGVMDMSITSAIMRYMLLANVTGIPALVFPVGYDEESETVICMQAMAKAWNEEVLLRVAAFADKELRPQSVKPKVECNPL